MDGYSVKDAALVLGIPERRVWELVARGVLSSAREGPDGMRVYLQPRSAVEAPEPRIYRADEPGATPPTNGNAGSHEMSPFRELLTEFRSLTERYGQALLALGEARGEVASLRSRVELLEARMDLRLPGTRPASTVAWEIPEYPPSEEPAPEAPAEPDTTAVDAATEAGPDERPEAPLAAQLADEDDQAEEPDGPAQGSAEPPPATATPSVARQRRAESRRRKIKGGRSALVGIAEALARAEDPTLAELPGAEDAAEAMAALQREVDASHAPEESAGEPEEAPQPEPMDADVPDVLIEASMPAISVPAAGLVADAEEAYEGEDGAALPDVIEVSYVTLAEAEEEPAEETQADAELEAAAVAAPAPPGPELEPEQEPEAEPRGTHELLAAPDSPYSADVVEPDWFADGDFTWLEAAQAEATPSSVETAAPPEEEPAAADQEAVVEPMSPATAEVEHEPEPLPEPAPEPAPPSAPEPQVSADIAGQADTFGPSAHDEFRAEEEARAAIQDAFHEEPPGDVETQASVAFDAVPEAEPMQAEPTQPAEDAIQEAFSDSPDDPDIPPGATQVLDQAETEAEPMEAQAEPMEARAEPVEPEPMQPEPEPMQSEASEPAEEAIQEAFGPPPTETVAEQHAPHTIEAPPSPEDQAPSSAPSGEEELMWLGDEFEEASIEVAAQGWRSADALPPPPVEPPPLELTDAELSQLAEDEGWDDAEVEAIRRLLGRPSTPDASAAELEAPPASVVPSAEIPAETVPGVPRPPQRHAMSSMSDPQWLRGRRGPAATAYRRLRRLFPG